MVIVAGHITVEPRRRESYLTRWVSIAERARRQLAVSISRSPPICSTRGRINIFERWESQAARESFRSSGPDKEQRAALLTVAVQEYIADVRPVFGDRTA
jgi:heme-degrading monooxygenase HmoA